MNLVRAFIAVKIPPELQRQIYQEAAPLRRQLDSNIVRWVVAKNIHLTLKFLGDTSTTKLDILKKTLATEVEKVPSFEIVIKKLGVFPNLSRPRVIWAGVEESKKLSTLHQCVQAAASQIGGVPEMRPFSAHLTLGRVTRKGYGSKPRRQIRKAIEGSSEINLNKIRVDSVHLFKSELNAKGAVYSSLFEARLGDFFE